MQDIPHAQPKDSRRDKPYQQIRYLHSFNPLYTVDLVGEGGGTRTRIPAVGEPYAIQLHHPNTNYHSAQGKSSLFSIS
ncbi:hypothetical protein GF373_17745 [bacterium]|nr:hypothetical protein [bacterium]